MVITGHKIRKWVTQGELDYDLENDILFFKVKDRPYSRSIETNNLVIDIDKEDFIVGLQIFEASKYLNVPKAALIKPVKWKFDAVLSGGKIHIALDFEVMWRNKIHIVRPRVTEPISEKLQNSEMICVAR